MKGFTDSLWYHTATERPVAQQLRGIAAVDVAVIGAGITGLSAALHLAEAGVRVAVAEADEIGAGASGRNGGFVVPHFAKGDPEAVIARLGEVGERLVDLVGNSARALFALVERHAIDCDAAQGGWFQAAHSASALKLIERRAQQWARRGQPVTLHDAADTERITGVNGYLGSWSNPTGGTLHPLKLVYGLASAASALGVQLFERSEVRAMRRDGKRWRLSTRNGELLADQVLVCTNALSRGLLPRLAVAVIPAAIYQVATEPIASDARQRLLGQGEGLSDTRVNLFTYRFDSQWRLITGAMPMLRYGAERRLAHQMAHRLRALLHLSAVPRIDFIWCGCASVGPGFLPALYEVDVGVTAGTGCNGRGVAVSAELGRIMAQALRAGSWRDVPLPLHTLRSVKSRRLTRWGVRWYPLYGAIRDRLE